MMGPGLPQQLVLLLLLVVQTTGVRWHSLAHEASQAQPSSARRWTAPSLSRQQLWASSLPRQPVRQQQVRPVLPDGDLKFQFYIYGGDGRLVQRRMSLQEVQDLLVECGVPLGGWPGPLMYSPAGALGAINLRRPSRPEDDILGVVATVQQVVSSEVAHNREEPPTFPANLTDHSAESIEIPEGILQTLLSLPQGLTTTQWQLPFTHTPPQTTYLSTVPWSLDTESTSEEPATITTTVTEMTTTPDADPVEDQTGEWPQGSGQTTKLPTKDRWNSRFPAWGVSPAGEEDGGATVVQDPEPTVDYHSSPAWLSDTVIPSSNDAAHGTGITTWNFIGDEDQESEGLTTLEVADHGEDLATVAASHDDTLFQATTAAVADNSQLTTKIDKDDLLLTTLTGLYAQSFTVGNPSKFPSLTTMMEAAFQDTTVTQPGPQMDASTMSPFQSTYFDVATDFSVGDPQSTSASESPTTVAQTDTQTSSSVKNPSSVYFPSTMETLPIMHKISETDASTSTDKPSEMATALSADTSTAGHITHVTSAVTLPSQTGSAVFAGSTNTPTLHYDENLLNLDIRNPAPPQSPYDIVPEDDQNLTYPSWEMNSVSSVIRQESHQSEEPVNPYDAPATLLEVLQHQGQASGHLVDRPHYEFPVFVEEQLTQTQGDASPQTTSVLSTQTQSAEDQYVSIRDLLTQYFTSTREPSTHRHTTQEPTTTTMSIAGPTTEHTTTQDATVPPTTTQSSVTVERRTPAPDATLQPQPSPAAGEVASPAALPDNYYYYSDNHPGGSSVLPSSQLAGSDRIDLEALQINRNLTEGDNFYDYYGSPVYLDNIPEEYYDYDVDQIPGPALNGTEDLGFPGPNATSPYHDHHGGHHDHHGGHHDHHGGHHGHHGEGPLEPAVSLLRAPEDNPGLEASVESLHPDVRKFVDVMNNITFKVYKRAAAQHRRRNFVMSPLSLISTLGMLLLGARGQTSGVLADLLQMDKFYTFNPHLVLKNVTQSVQEMRDIHDVTFLNQFLVEKEKNPYSTEFFARTIKVFYDAVIEGVSPAELDERVRQTVNQAVSNNTRGKVNHFLLQTEPLYLTPPLTTVATSLFHASWSLPVLQQDLLDMNFLRFPSAERRLIRTVGLKKKMTINAGFSRAAGVTSAEVPLYSRSGELSLVLLMPGEQKNFVANGLSHLEARLTPGRWRQALRSMLPNTLHLKMPVFRHRAFHNFSSILSDIGLTQLFQDTADFSGINHIKNLHLSDVVQLTEFQSCQVEDAAAAVRGAPARRSRRSDGTEKREAPGGTPHYQPTYIYGFPMLEYLQAEKMKLTRMEPGGHRPPAPPMTRLRQESSSSSSSRQNGSSSSSQTTTTDSSSQQSSSADSSSQQSSSADSSSQQSSSADSSSQQSSSADSFSQQSSSADSSSQQSSPAGSSSQQSSPAESSSQQTSSTDSSSQQTSPTDSSSQQSSPADSSSQQSSPTDSSSQQSSPADSSSQQSSPTDSSSQQSSPADSSSQQSSPTDSSSQQSSPADSSSQQSSTTDSSSQQSSPADSSSQQSSPADSSSQQTSPTDSSSQQSSPADSSSQQTSSTDSSSQQSSTADSSSQQIPSTDSSSQQTPSTDSSSQQTPSTDSSSQQTSPTDSSSQQSSTTDSSSQQSSTANSSSQQASSTDSSSQQSSTEDSSSEQTSPTDSFSQQSSSVNSSSQQSSSVNSSSQQSSSVNSSSQQSSSVNSSSQQSSSVNSSSQQSSSVNSSSQQSSSANSSSQQSSSVNSSSQQSSSANSSSQQSSSVNSSSQQSSSANSSSQQSSSADNSSQRTSPTVHARKETSWTGISPGQKHSTPLDTRDTHPQDGNPVVSPSFSDYYYYNYDNYNIYDNGEGNTYFAPEDYEVDRMGVLDAPQDTRPSDGAYYRQSEVGTLAFDRAFLYAVRHNPTGLLLFIGRYLDPEAN